MNCLFHRIGQSLPVCPPLFLTPYGAWEGEGDGRWVNKEVFVTFIFEFFCFIKIFFSWTFTKIALDEIYNSCMTRDNLMTR